MSSLSEFSKITEFLNGIITILAPQDVFLLGVLIVLLGFALLFYKTYTNTNGQKTTGKQSPVIKTRGDVIINYDCSKKEEDR